MGERQVASSGASTTSSELSKPTPFVTTPAEPTKKQKTEKNIVEDGGIEAGALSRELTKELSRIDTSDFPSAFPLAMITIALMMSVFLCALDMTIVATAIPRITDQFHSLDQVGWYGSAFFLTLGAFQSTWGKAYKYFPLKLSFLISIFIFEPSNFYYYNIICYKVYISKPFTQIIDQQLFEKLKTYKFFNSIFAYIEYMVTFVQHNLYILSSI